VTKEINTREKEYKVPTTDYLTEELIEMLPKGLVFFPKNDFIDGVYIRSNVICISNNYLNGLCFRCRYIYLALFIKHEMKHYKRI